MSPTHKAPPALPTLAELESDDLAVEVEVRDLAFPTDLHRQRLDRALVTLLPEFSRNHLKHMIEEGCVSVGEQVVTKVAHLVKAFDSCQVRLQPTDMSQAFVPQDLPLDVVFEDEHLRVIHKSVGMVVHPAPGNWSGTLLNGLLFLDAGLKLIPRAGIVHRLDKDTSGLMVTARTHPAMDALVQMIAARQVHREYLAIAHRSWRGALLREVDAPIGRDSRQRLRMAVVDLAKQSGKTAHTSLRCLDSQELGCLVHCTLHTGRTHQIRVHMSSIGHPLLADTLYGGSHAANLQRQALHAYKLGFIHPMTGESLQFHRPLPSDMQQALSDWGLSEVLS
jgi:23S rRNA pseudouridine1911/1915/1917 synthase